MEHRFTIRSVRASRWLLLVILASLSTTAFGYSELVIFGDSLSDVGNVRSRTLGFAVSDPYWEGRFSNGPVYVEYLADLLGIDSPIYSVAGGTNYAHGGAQVTVDSFAVDSLETQKDDYLAANSGVAVPDTLYVVFGGANDARDTSIDLVSTAAELVSIVDDLIQAGATNIVVPSIPDLAKTPEVTEYNQGAGAASTARSLLYNDTVDAGLSQLSASANIIRFDVFGLMNELIEEVTSNGSSRGFTNVIDDCWEGGPATATSGLGLGDGFFTTYPQCSNPDEYLFWDILHPTTAAHELFAGELYQQLTAIDGDFDDNGQFDCADIDALVAEIAAGGNDAQYDLTSDGFVDLDDRDAWLAEAGANNLPSGNEYLPGDATLDGNVDGSDFLAWNANKFALHAAWCAGDFNADGVIDGVDFLVWNSHKFTNAGDAASVPEPSGLNALWLTVLAIVAGRRLVAC